LIVKFPQTISPSDSVAMVWCRWLNAENGANCHRAGRLRLRSMGKFSIQSRQERWLVRCWLVSCWLVSCWLVS
ncbi:MAG: hypothetical protein ACOYLF_10205, partial [Blastocatellia bacterium]